jgi:hypothetical protein
MVFVFDVVIDSFLVQQFVPQIFAAFPAFSSSIINQYVVSIPLSFAVSWLPFQINYCPIKRDACDPHLRSQPSVIAHS